MKNLKGNKAVVTGGAMGIGLETTRRLLKEGVDVTVWDMNESAMEDAKKNLNNLDGRLYTYKCDVSDKNKVFELAKEAKDKMGSVDILVNSAGYVKPGRFIDQPIEDAVKATEVNLHAIYYTTYAFLPAMLERNNGYVINVSSSAGLLGVPDLAAYCATKFAVLGFTETLRLEAMRDKKHGVNFSTIHPHFIKEGMFEGSSLNLIGNLFVPLVKNHDVIARAIVEKAIKKKVHVVKCPWTIQIAPLGRALLTSRGSIFLLQLTGINKGMKDWVGRQETEHANK